MAKRKKRKQGKMDRTLPTLKPNAAGIDMGATEAVAAVPADRDSSTAGGSGITQWLDIIDDVVFTLDGLRSQIEHASKECECGQNVLRPYPVKQVEECFLKGRSNAPSPDPGKSQADLNLKGESDSDARSLRSRLKKLGL